MHLSKSLYTRGLQCVKSLWLKKYKKDILTPPDSLQKAVFERGDMVGELACKLFPDGHKIPFDNTTFSQKIELTKKLIDSGIKNIYEATFEYDSILVMIDILHINEDKTFEIYEVKSSTEVKPVYLDDASIQYYVLNGLGYTVKKTNIVHLNSSYIRKDYLEIDKLFTIKDISQEVAELQENIPSHLKNFERFLKDNKNEPDISIGEQCLKPYECDAKAYCWRDIPEYSVFDISRLKSAKKFELYHKGIVTFDDIENISSFSTSQQIQILSEKNSKSIINKDAIKEFLDSLSYPIYHLDFETFQQAVPQWRGVSPYMQIPFQYSLHIQHKNGDLEHKEFLAKEGEDPRYELTKKLVEDIPTDATVLAYNMGFEKGVIKKLAEMFTEFAPRLMAIHDNIQDLMTPFAKKDYYLPSMKGSYSIKQILPALVPDMAKAYKELDFVQNGGQAMQTFAKLALIENKQELKKLREALLKYCELDTLAMVRILERLKEIG